MPTKSNQDMTWPEETAREHVNEPTRERETSVQARIVRSISVSMSLSEMDLLIRTFGRHYDELSPGEKAVQREIVAAVEDLTQR